MQSTARQELRENVNFVIHFSLVLPPILKKRNVGYGKITEMVKSGSRTAEFHGPWKNLMPVIIKTMFIVTKELQKKHDVKITTIVVFSEVESRGSHSLTYDLGAYLVQHGEASLLQHQEFVIRVLNQDLQSSGGKRKPKLWLSCVNVTNM